MTRISPALAPPTAPPGRGLDPVARRAVAWFLGTLAVLTAAVMVPLWVVGADADAFNAAVPLLSWAPALSALTAHLLTGRRTTFARWTALRPLASRRVAGTCASVLGVFLVVPAMTTALGVATGVVEWQPTAEAWGLAPLVLPFALLALVTVVGEEIGWRGALQTTLAPWGAWRASLLIAGLWSLWHLPLTLGYASTGDLAVRDVVATSVDLLVVGVLLSAARLASSSMWPAAWAHALMNSTLAFAESNLTTSARELADGPFWAAQAITWVVLAVTAGGAMAVTSRAPSTSRW
ncbi:CPBP family intramembrane metalloprotease [Actinotalea sp. BY-33]|uniref:CPBP family intramembrane metalloprotease n=1 Tax=Actinotalea soli TaxID=2819234 RepID=A0A939RVX5_9CELL|nr:CPBP family intramembrane glutamic endopeptidase [Actinotalea soli]MBO1752845.1 CPBP family intramembrane metalloprotease [Actinotalea soli]